jgi:hypothetical protein
MEEIITTPNNAPAPNRRPRFSLGAFREFDYLFSALPTSAAAVVRSSVRQQNRKARSYEY